ncbi:hypothetical protein RhiirB3_448055, partial [Rhizophagus irregularis]
LFIIIISFAHAFYILLSPKSEISLEQYNTNNNNDPNNPWNLAPSYSQIDNNGNINSNPLMIQIPDKNTNMFIDIKTSLFAIYLFLIGDSSALSNWPYTENPSIAVLIVLFSLLVVTRGEVQRLIKEGEWNTKEFTEMRNILLKKLEIEYNPIDNEAILEKLKSHEKLLKENNNEVILEKLKSHDEKLDKLEELEKLKELEKLLKEICAK